MSATDPVREWGPELGDVIAVVQSRAISLEDAWAVLAAARPAIEREAKAAAWDEGFAAANEVAEGCHDCIGYADEDDLPRNPYRAALATGTDDT